MSTLAKILEPRHPIVVAALCTQPFALQVLWLPLRRRQRIWPLACPPCFRTRRSSIPTAWQRRRSPSRALTRSNSRCRSG
ncbi:hypothetical protein BD310DRAFT_925827 [Dichomitus squalens]|uniref:Uncharacterized protein n=1 Tax=Dichomitus squalens TaxID=114155 RepID=A0A4Q9PWV3_9APHY|nr:hypothetical protein BD310DRAFT_925827 [Dichomitus squalens]